MTALLTTPMNARLVALPTTPPAANSRDRWAGMAAAALLHALVFLAGGFAFSTPARYGVEAGAGGVEVELVAAPRATAEAPALQPPAGALPDPLEAAALTVPAEPKPVAEGPSGDGSSSLPGRDATTASRSAGAHALARPHYLQNRAPDYPEVARRRREEGLVLLSVRVDRSGRVTDLSLKESSGHPLLDEAARRAVRAWRFQPAMAGPLPVESAVEVPVRFQLED